MNEAERYKQYLICKERGHSALGKSDGSWDICPKCDTYHRWISSVQEKNVPTNPEET